VDDGVWFTLVQISHAPGHPEAVAMNQKKPLAPNNADFNMEIYPFSSEKTNYLAISSAYLSTF
jgi:hypothetical protein